MILIHLEESLESTVISWKSGDREKKLETDLRELRNTMALAQ